MCSTVTVDNFFVAIILELAIIVNFTTLFPYLTEKEGQTYTRRQSNARAAQRAHGHVVRGFREVSLLVF